MNILSFFRNKLTDSDSDSISLLWNNTWICPLKPFWDLEQVWSYVFLFFFIKKL